MNEKDEVSAISVRNVLKTDRKEFNDLATFKRRKSTSEFLRELMKKEVAKAKQDPDFVAFLNRSE